MEKVKISSRGIIIGVALTTFAAIIGGSQVSFQGQLVDEGVSSSASINETSGSDSSSSNSSVSEGSASDSSSSNSSISDSSSSNNTDSGTSDMEVAARGESETPPAPNSDALSGVSSSRRNSSSSNRSSARSSVMSSSSRYSSHSSVMSSSSRNSSRSSVMSSSSRYSSHSSVMSSARRSSLSSSRNSSHSNSASSACMQIQKADLSVILSTNKDKVVSGGNVVYSMTVKNKGTNIVSDAHVFLTKEQMTFVTSNTGSCQDDGAQDAVRCSVGTLAPGASTKIDITMIMSSFTCPQNGMAVKTKYAYVKTLGGSIDIHPQDNASNFVVTDYDCGFNNAGSVCMPLKTSDLSAVLTQDQSKVAPGNTVTYTITVKNKGPDAIADATAYLPTEGMSFVSSNTGMCYMPDGLYDVIRCPTGFMASGATTQITVVMRMNGSCPQNGMSFKTKFAYIASNGQNADLQPQDNTSRFVTTQLDCGQ